MTIQRETTMKILNPGSDAAIEQGCACPVTDNRHGQGCGWKDHDGNPLFWINEACPLHGAKVTQINSK
jgi:hypothetical protein